MAGRVHGGHAGRMLVYRALLLLKFTGLLALAGGTLAGLLAATAAERKRAVHHFASPGLLVTWGAGYLLSTLLGVALTELWTLGGLTLSFGSHLALVHAAAHGPSKLLTILVVLPLFSTLALMVFRPTWAGLWP